MTEDAALKRTAGDLRIVGVVLAILGTLVSFAAASDSAGTVAMRTLLAADVLILLLPGVWFTLASSMVRGGQGAAIVTWSLRVVGVQLAACAVAVGVVFIGNARWTTSHGPPPVVVPMLLLVLFAPAQAVLIWQLARARQLIDARDARRGFTASDAPVVADVVALPVDADATAIPVARACDDGDPTAQRPA